MQWKKSPKTGNGENKGDVEKCVNQGSVVVENVRDTEFNVGYKALTGVNVSTN